MHRCREALHRGDAGDVAGHRRAADRVPVEPRASPGGSAVRSVDHQADLAVADQRHDARATRLALDVRLTGCRQESVEDRTYRLLAATLEEGGPRLRQRNRVEALRVTYAVNVQGNRAEDVPYATKAEALQQRTDSVLGYLEQLRGDVLSVSRAKPDRKSLGGYLTGNGSAESRGKLYPLYRLLQDYRKSLGDVPGHDVAPGLFFPAPSTVANLPHDTLRAFLLPFREATATQALALLAAYKARILLEQAGAIEYVRSHVGARSIRDYFSAPLLANARQDNVKIGSEYEADLYVAFGLEKWTHYKTLINGKPVNLSRPNAILTAARSRDGRPGQWEARMYLFNNYDEDTVLTIRRPFPLHTPHSVTPAQKP